MFEISNAAGRRSAGPQESPMELHAPELFRQQAFIDGHWCEADQGRRTDIHNPATGERLGSVPDMAAAETRRAIAAAQTAQAAWRRRTAKERSAVLRCWFELIVQHQEDLARIMTAEQRSEERRVGKERGARWRRYRGEKKQKSEEQCGNSR